MDLSLIGLNLVLFYFWSLKPPTTVYAATEEGGDHLPELFVFEGTVCKTREGNYYPPWNIPLMEEIQLTSWGWQFIPLFTGF